MRFLILLTTLWALLVFNPGTALASCESFNTWIDGRLIHCLKCCNQYGQCSVSCL